VPEWTLDPEVLGRALSTLGKQAVPGIIAHAKDVGIPLPPGVGDGDVPPAEVYQLLRGIMLHYFPGLAAPTAASARP
jgi:phospholipase C